jgi:hypothetical protein
MDLGRIDRIEEVLAPILLAITNGLRLVVNSASTYTTHTLKILVAYDEVI